MGFNPKVSIIVPVYNGSNYMREAIDSALSQTYKNIEVIVVNDGSNDGGKTEAIAKSYGDKIRYLYKENGGVASALNLGISKMSGDYFSWLSHDDIYYPNKIEVQIDYLSRLSKKDIVLYSDYDLIDHSSKKIGTRRNKNVESNRFIFSFLIDHPINGCTILIPKVCFDVVGFFNENLKTTQDYEMWFRIARKYKIIHIPKILIEYRLHAEQDSITMGHAHFYEESNFFVYYLNEIYSETNNNSLSTHLLRNAIYFKKIKFYEASRYAFDLAIKKLSISLFIINMILIIEYCTYGVYCWLDKYFLKRASKFLSNFYSMKLIINYFRGKLHKLFF